MLVNTRNLLNDDVGDRVQTLASDSSTVESQLSWEFQTELFNHFDPAILKQSKLQFFLLPHSFFSFPWKSFQFRQIDTLSQEVSSQTFLQLSTFKCCQSTWNAGLGCCQLHMLQGKLVTTTLGWDSPEPGSATYSMSLGTSFQDRWNKIQNWLPNSCLRPLFTVSWSCSSRFLSVKWDFPFSLGCCQEFKYYIMVWGKGKKVAEFPR